MNEITYVEAARKLAEGMLLEGGATPEARVEWAFQRVLARKPDTFERDTITQRLKARLEKLAPAQEASLKIISLGHSKPAASLPPGELAAYTVTANVLLNLDEAVSRP